MGAEIWTMTDKPLRKCKKPCGAWRPIRRLWITEHTKINKGDDMVTITKSTADKIPYIGQVANDIASQVPDFIIDITGGYKGAFVPSVKYTYTFDTDGLRKDIIDYVQTTIPTTTSSD